MLYYYVCDMSFESVYQQFCLMNIMQRHKTKQETYLILIILS